MPKNKEQILVDRVFIMPEGFDKTKLEGVRKLTVDEVVRLPKIKEFISKTQQATIKETLKKVRKGKIFVSSYGCIDCHGLIPNSCDRCRRLRSS